MSEVTRVIVPCSGESESRYLALRVFTAVHRYYKENGTLLCIMLSKIIQKLII